LTFRGHVDIVCDRHTTSSGPFSLLAFDVGGKWAQTSLPRKLFAEGTLRTAACEPDGQAALKERIEVARMIGRCGAKTNGAIAPEAAHPTSLPIRVVVRSHRS
jgi:hypothetical protein